ncbi:MAG TPA: hypothetical protein VMH02_05165 [Verrucomicrobiae bacterium]|nr:hypothetical protein [Verrucomicrobiae bacterium]
MRRLAILVVLVVLALLAIVAWHALWGGGTQNAAYATLFPTGPIACPQNPGDLSGIEGWAPGAGHAAEMGNSAGTNAGGFAGGLAGSAPSPEATAPASPCTGLSPALAARFDRIAADATYIPTDGFDPAARAGELADLDAAFAFVRDHIQTDAYAGSMRGAAGTLQARAGSPADKALLLAALLASKGVPVRFVHAQLGDGDVAAVVAAVLASPPPQPPPNLSAAFAAMGVDPSASRTAAGALRQRTQAAADATIAAAAAPAQTLLATLASKNVALASSDAALRAAWAANLRDHWWLQVEVDGAWVDYDPTLPSAKAGTHVGPAALPDTADDLPAGVRATIDVRLVATRFGAAAPATLVERTMDLRDVDASPIVVTIGDRDGGSSAIATATSFVPSIGSGGGETTGDAFASDALATVDLEIVVTQPGAPPRLYRRSVLDRRLDGSATLDPAWTPRRTAYALTAGYTLLPLAGDLDPGFAGLREVEGLRTVQAFMAYAAAGGDGTQLPPLAPQTYPMQALHYYAYDQLIRRRLESSGAVRFYFDRPQLAIEHHGFDLAGNVPRAIAGFDVVENGMSASGTQPSAAVRENFTRGYVDEFAEQHLFSAPSDGGTIALLEAARKSGIALEVLQGDRYGGVAIAPSKPVQLDGSPRMGWWQVDVQNGNLIGRMGPDGAGQELAEYAIARANDWSTLLSMVEFYGDFFRCIAGAVEAPLEGRSGARAQEWFKQCAGAALCSYLEALGSSEAISRAEWSDLQALMYNILDMSVTGSKDAWPPSGGYACGKFFKSPL